MQNTAMQKHQEGNLSYTRGKCFSERVRKVYVLRANLVTGYAACNMHLTEGIR
jgi:hypothetical protein